MPTRDEVIDKLKQQLDTLNAKLGDLEAKANAASGEARAEYQKRIQHLHEMSEPARDKLRELRGAGEEHWDRLSAEAEKHYKALVHSFNYFKSQIK